MVFCSFTYLGFSLIYFLQNFTVPSASSLLINFLFYHFSYSSLQVYDFSFQSDWLKNLTLYYSGKKICICVCVETKWNIFYMFIVDILVIQWFLLTHSTFVCCCVTGSRLWARGRNLAYAGCSLPACYRRHVAILPVPLSSLTRVSNFRTRCGYLEVTVLPVLGSNRHVCFPSAF